MYLKSNINIPALSCNKHHSISMGIFYSPILEPIPLSVFYYLFRIFRAVLIAILYFLETSKNTSLFLFSTAEKSASIMWLMDPL